MRVTASRVYSRPVKVPKMPPGLVELMEGLTRDVLENNPSDVYEFCANHMQKLLELRDGPTSKKPLTLEQKISRAQEKVKQRAEKRWQKYLEQIKETKVDTNDKTSAVIAVKDIAAQDSMKPIHHEDDLNKLSEIEIACGSASTESAVSAKRDNLENTSVVQKKENSNENVHVSADIKSDDNEEKLATVITETNIEQGSGDIVLMTPSAEGVEEEIGNASEINDVVEGNMGTSLDEDEDGEKTNVLNVSELSDQENTASVVDVLNIVENSLEKCPNKIIEISTVEIHNLGFESEEDKPDQINHSALLLAEPDIETQELIQPNANNLEDVSKVLPKDIDDNREQTIQQNFLDILTSSQINKIITINDNTTENINCNNSKKENEEEKSNESTAALTLVTGNIENKPFNSENKTNDGKILNADKSDIETKNLQETKIDDLDHKLSEILILDPINIDAEKKNSAVGGNHINQIESVAVTDTTGIDSIEMNAITTTLDGMETTEKADDSTETEKGESIVQIDQNLDGKISEDSSIAMLASVDTSIEHSNEKMHIKNELEVSNISESDVLENIPIETNDSDPTNLESQTLVKCASLEDSTNESNSTLEGGVTDCSEETIQNDNTNNMDLETAAVTIQKVFRTFLFKSRASTFDDSTNEDNNLSDDEEVAELKDDRSFMTSNLNKERRSLGISRMDTVLQTVNEEKSLSLSTDDSSLSSAATIIQAHVRGFLVRNKFNSGKTVSSNSLGYSNWPSTTSIEGDIDPHKNKTVLNIHIVPEGGNYLSRDESMITSMDLSLDGSPPSSVNLHPLGYDKTERRKRLKREDAVQSVSPPSNNSGKLSEDSVKELPLNGVPVNASLEQETVSAAVTVDVDDQETAVKSVETVPLNNLTVDIVLEEDQKHKNGTLTTTDVISQASDTEIHGKNKRSLSKQSSDEMDVVTPFKEDSTPRDLESNHKLVHSGEFHDIVLPTKVSRSDTPVASGE